MAKIDLSDIYTELNLRLRPSVIELEDSTLGTGASNVPCSPNTDYYLFMQGTDTVFIKEPTSNLPKGHKERRTYKRGETLSFAAQTIACMKEENPRMDPSNVNSFSSPSVDMVNGPTTLGTEVGDRIARAIYLIFRAVASGKKTLQLTGFSRGAAESVLILHELERIKIDLATSNKTLLDIFCDSPCKFTRAAMKDLFVETPNPDIEQLRPKLSEDFNALQINTFLIDPVPGGGPAGIGAWVDTRFGKALPSHRSEIILCRDERTAYFTPIVPDGVQKVVIVPGAHGTACGNQYDQHLQKPWKKPGEKSTSKGRTTTVQDLVLCKLFDFWRGAGLSLKKEIDAKAFGHEALGLVINAYLQAPDESKQDVLLQHYKAVHQHDALFRLFTAGNYPLLGQQTSKDKKHRRVHFRGQQDISMAVLESTFQECFVNTEHAILELNTYMGEVLSNVTSSTEQVKASEMAQNLTQLLKNIASQIQDSVENSPLTLALRTREVKPVFFEALSMRAELISQKYLRNHLKADEKHSLMQAIIDSFDALSNAREGLVAEALNEVVAAKIALIDECKNKLQESLKQTVEGHFEWLQQESAQLNEKINLFLNPEDFSDIWNQCLSALKDIPETEVIANELVSRDSVTISATQADLVSALEKITLQPEVKEKVDAILQPALVYFDVYQYDLAYYLHNIELFHEAVKSLKQGCPKLKELVGDKKLNLIEAELQCFNVDLAKSAGRLLKVKGHHLSIVPAGVSEEFYEEAKKEALAQGAASPEYVALEVLYKTSQVQNEELIADIEAKKLALMAAEEKATTQQQAIEVLETSTEKLERDIETKKALLVELEEKSTRQQEALDAHEASKTALLHDIEVKEAQLLALEEKTSEQQESLEAHEETKRVLLADIDAKKAQFDALAVTSAEQLAGLNDIERTKATLIDDVNLKSERLALLEENARAQQARLDALDASKAELLVEVQTKSTQLNDLKRVSTEQQDEIKALRASTEKSRALNAELFSTKEFEYSALIHQKLKPLINNYLKHLLKAAKKHDSTINMDTLDQNLPEKLGDKPYALIKDKFEKVQVMQQALLSTKALPSVRVGEFYTSLRYSNQELVKHRDSAWTKFAKGCLLLLATLMTGIVPALIYAAATRGRTPFFFCKSHGERFTEASERLDDTPKKGR